MINRNIYETLGLLGLSEQEAKLYVAFISNGPSTIVHIAKALNMERTAVYPILRRLVDKGFATETYVGLKKKYVAISPDQLENLAEFTKSKIRAVVPELQALHIQAHEATEFSVLQGTTPIKNFYESLLNDLKVGDFYYAISNSNSFISDDSDYFKSFIKRRNDKGVRVALLIQDTPENRDLLSQYPVLAKTVRLFTSPTPISVSKTITSSVMAIHQTIASVHVIATRNKNVIEMERVAFELLWGRCELPIAM